MQPRFRAREGTLEWYCIDHWSRELQLDIAALKHGDAHHIRWLPGAREFLGRVRSLGKRLVLVTNAHPTTLAIKDAHTQVISHFDAGFSSHSFGAAQGAGAVLDRARQGACNLIRPAACSSTTACRYCVPRAPPASA